MNRIAGLLFVVHPSISLSLCHCPMPKDSAFNVDHHENLKLPYKQIPYSLLVAWH